MFKHVNYVFALLFCLGASAYHAQDGITVSGGDASGSGGSVAFSIGQLFFAETINNHGTVHEGVELAFEVAREDSINTRVYCLCVYPNPTEGNLTLEVPAFHNENYNYKMFSALGVQLMGAEVGAFRTTLDTQLLPMSVYILQVMKNDEVVETFKILKK